MKKKILKPSFAAICVIVFFTMALPRLNANEMVYENQVRVSNSNEFPNYHSQDNGGDWFFIISSNWVIAGPMK